MRYMKSAALGLFLAAFILSSQASASSLDQALQADWQNVSALYPTPDNADLIVVDVTKQTLYLLINGQRINAWPVSTALRGSGSGSGSNQTPLGVFKIVRKIGSGLPPFEILNSGGASGEMAAPVYAANDLGASNNMTTRLMALEGLEPGWNEGGAVDTAARHIFIHGTANLGMLGQPASLGCVQMSPGAVIALYNQVPPGTLVLITTNAQSPLIPGLDAPSPPMQIAGLD